MEQKLMTLGEIIELVGGKIVSETADLQKRIQFGFAADLLSDVLTLENTDVVFITGLCNLQTIRTAEMADIGQIIFVRGKKVTSEMKKIARDNNIVLVESPISLFRASGILYSAGLQPVY